MRQEWRTRLKRYVSTAPYILVGILILAALLRFHHLGRESLWWDEALTVAIVRNLSRGRFGGATCGLHGVVPRSDEKTWRGAVLQSHE
jgi:hypothetical protein